MQVEIWSDVVCPFCYIGKRHFEQALAQFPHRDQLNIVWRSYQLDPDMKAAPGTSAIDYLAKAKGQTREWSEQAHAHVTAMASEVGLDYRFDRAVVANTFDAHRLIQMARTEGKADAVEEALFSAYFTEGKDIGNHAVLAEIGAAAGLDAAAVRAMLASDDFSEAVALDVYASRQVGLRGVPYFAFNDRYAVTGARPADVILGALNTSYKEWLAARPAAERELIEGAVCRPDGSCD